MSLDVFQTVFSLSLTSSLVNNLKGTQVSLQRTLQRGLDLTLPSIGGDWQVVWGPVVWKHAPEDASSGPDNSWYIAFNPCLQFEDGSVHPTYVIAIAGTPQKSQYVWIRENFAVNTVTDFKAWVAGGIKNSPSINLLALVQRDAAYIAKGTVNTVHMLLTMPAPEGAAGAGTTLLDFITDVGRSNANRFIPTGHSLGGALSPSLALSLVTAGVIPASNTMTYPSAGPSPGNKAFVDLFVASFPARRPDNAKSYQGWNVNLVNTLDIVPQAWCPLRTLSNEQNLANIPPIYGQPMPPLVLGFTLVFGVHVLSSGMLYCPLPSQYFTAPPPSSQPYILLEFLKVVGKQHVPAYFTEVGVAPPKIDKSQLSDSGISQKGEDESRYNFPVISQLEWGREHPEEAQQEIAKVEGTEQAKVFLENMSPLPALTNTVQSTVTGAAKQVPGVSRLFG